MYSSTSRLIGLVAGTAFVSVQMVQDCNLCSRSNTSRVHCVVAGTALVSLQMMQDGGLCSRSSTSRVHGLVARTAFVSLPMMQDCIQWTSMCVKHKEFCMVYFLDDVKTQEICHTGLK